MSDFVFGANIAYKELLATATDAWKIAMLHKLQDLILERHALRVVLLEPCLGGVDVCKHLAIRARGFGPALRLIGRCGLKHRSKSFGKCRCLGIPSGSK